MSKPKPGRIASRSPRALPPWGLGYKSGEELARLMPKEISGDPKLYAESFDAVPAGMKMEPESVYDNRFVLKALGR